MLVGERHQLCGWGLSESDSDSDGEAARQSHPENGMSGVSLLRQAIGVKYNAGQASIDTQFYIDIRSPRVFVWCLRKDCGSEADCNAAATLAIQIKCAR